MSGRWIAVVVVGLASIGAVGIGIAVAQNVSSQAATLPPAVARDNPPDVNGWRTAGPRVARRLADAVEDANLRPAVGEENAQSQPAAELPTERAPPRSSILREGRLPSGQGQVWQEYDISPFTRRVTTTNRPEQLVIDWVLRETGYEAWHSDVVSVLSADKDMLRVYHTPQMQRVVADLVDRFVNPQPVSYTHLRRRRW